MKKPQAAKDKANDGQKNNQHHENKVAKENSVNANATQRQNNETQNQKPEPPTRKTDTENPNAKPETQNIKPEKENPEEIAKKAAEEKTRHEAEAAVKEVEKALFAVRFYPVAVSEQSKEEAMDKLASIYNQSNDTIRQLILYMIHEILSTSSELKVMQTYDYFRIKQPNLDQAQLRMNVYRAMFNYNTSIEGLVDIIHLLGRFRKSNDTVKLLTYHFSHYCTYETESSHLLRAAILETLGKCDSIYALKVLLGYARYTDNERTFHRIVAALMEWERRLGDEKLGLSASEKEGYIKKLKEVVSREFSESHYG